MVTRRLPAILVGIRQNDVPAFCIAEMDRLLLETQDPGDRTNDVHPTEYELECQIWSYRDVLDKCL